MHQTCLPEAWARQAGLAVAERRLGNIPAAQAAMRDPGLLSLRQNPLLDPLQGDPRFRALLARVAAG